MAKTELKIDWYGGKAGDGTLKAGYLDTKVAVPKSLGGSGDGTDPKELLISSATTCYIATLTFMLENRKLPVEELSVNTEATKYEDGFYIIHNPENEYSNDSPFAHPFYFYLSS